MFDCISRQDNRHYLRCTYNAAPDDSNTSYIFVLGSRGLIGIPLMQKLRNKGYRIAEVRSKYHDHVEAYHPQLSFINASFVFDLLPGHYLRPNYTVPSIIFSNYSSNVTSRFPNQYQFTPPSMWGPFFPHKAVDGPNKLIWDCIHQNPNITLYDQLYANSEDVADELINQMDNILAGKSVKFRPKLYPASYFAHEIEKIGCSINIKKQKPPFRFHLLFQRTLDFVDEFITPHPERTPYFSFVTTLSNWKRVVDNANIMFRRLGELFQDQGTSVEFIIVYKGNVSFSSIYTIPETIKSRTKVVIAQPEGEFFEYKLRNIGIRRAQGEYIATISSDVIFSWTIADCINRRLFVPNGFYRSYRAGNVEKDEIDSADYSSDLDDVTQNEINYLTDPNDLRSVMLTQASGDFIAAHRSHWYDLRGFVENGLTLHIDSLFLTDFAFYPFPIYVRLLGNHYHLFHVKTSVKLPALDHRRSTDWEITCSGRPSYLSADLARDENWGMANITFPEESL